MHFLIIVRSLDAHTLREEKKEAVLSVSSAREQNAARFRRAPERYTNTLPFLPAALSLSLNPTIKNPILGPPTFHQDHSHSSARTAKCHLKAAQLPQQPPSSTVAPPPPTSTLLVVKPATILANPHPPYTPPSPQSKSKASKKHST